MLAHSEDSEINPDKIASPARALTGEVSDPAGDADSLESDVAAPTPPVVEPPPGLLRLKAYCDENNLKTDIEFDDPQFITVEFPNGRSTRTAYIGSEEAADNLLHYPLQELVFLGAYSAICSYKGGWIEAAVRAHGAGPRNLIARRSIFGISGAGIGDTELRELEISGPQGLTLRLTEKRGCLYWLDYGAPLYLRIEGIGITEHDKATNLLEDLSNSLFLQIDFRFNSPLTVGKGRQLRRFPRSRGKRDEDSQLIFPRYSYHRSPSALYWYARSASSMPLLQFLAFYQSLEFYFPQYSRQEAIAKIKNILRDPLFDGTKDSSINIVLNATMEGHRGSLLEERKQLGATLKQCVDATALRDFLSETEERKRYYEQDYKTISKKGISLSENAPVVDQTADRIYDIRCKVVHTKNLEGAEGDEIILPFSKEEDLLMDDVQLIQFLARKVLIASSAPLNI